MVLATVWVCLVTPMNPSCLPSGLHPHQSSGPMPNPAIYAAPPVSMSPGQPPPQQLLAPPFYPPPGVMTFGNTNYPYPAGATLPPMYNPPVRPLPSRHHSYHISMSNVAIYCTQCNTLLLQYADSSAILCIFIRYTYHFRNV